MNAPISLIGTALGTVITEFFDRIAFDASCYRVLKTAGFIEEVVEGSNTFSSLSVMVITGVWGYVLANIVNGSKSKDNKDKKEL